MFERVIALVGVDECNVPLMGLVIDPCQSDPPLYSGYLYCPCTPEKSPCLSLSPVFLLVENQRLCQDGRDEKYTRMDSHCAMRQLTLMVPTLSWN